MTYSDPQIWAIILGMGIGTFVIRFSFLGLIGDRALPPFVLRLLRYTAVAVIPGLMAPLVVWPAATGGEPDAARLAAALVTLALGLWFRNVLLAVFGGVAALYLVQWLAS